LQSKNIVIKDEALLARVIGVQISRAKTFDELAAISGFFFAVPDYEAKLLIWKDSSTLKEVTDVLSSARVVLCRYRRRGFLRARR